MIVPVMASFGSTEFWLWLAQAATAVSGWAASHAKQPESVEERNEDLTQMVRQPRRWSLLHPVRAIRRKMTR